MSADNFKKVHDLDGSTPEPAIRSGDTSQRIPCFESCQLITTLMCNQFLPGLQNQLESVRVNIGSLWCGRTVSGRSVYGHVITKFSGMGRCTKLWGSANKYRTNCKSNKDFSCQLKTPVTIKYRKNNKCNKIPDLERKEAKKGPEMSSNIAKIAEVTRIFHAS